MFRSVVCVSRSVCVRVYRLMHLTSQIQESVRVCVFLVLCVCVCVYVLIVCVCVCVCGVGASDSWSPVR